LKRINHGTGTEEINDLKQWFDFFHNREIKGFKIKIVKVYESDKTYIIREYIPYQTLKEHIQLRHTYSKEHKEIVSYAEYAVFEILRQVGLLKEIGLMKGLSLHYGNVSLNILTNTIYIFDPV